MHEQLRGSEMTISERRSVLVTGAFGFIGRALCSHLRASGWDVRNGPPWDKGGETPSADGWLRWADQLEGCTAVVHLAGRAHVDARSAGDASAEASHRLINVHWTAMLARAAVAAGVRRFVFASSVKACGEEKDTPYREEDQPAPEDIYGQTKLQAEQELAKLSRSSDLEVVVIRLPLVYGPHVRANFLRMMRLVDREIPLPLAAIGNRRSLIGLDNLASAIALCLEHPRAAGRLYFVSDQADVSTPALLGKLATALGRRSFLIPVPRKILELGASLFGAEESFRRLTGSLAIDSSRISQELNWRPVISLEEGFARTAHWYKSEK